MVSNFRVKPLIFFLKPFCVVCEKSETKKAQN